MNTTDKITYWINSADNDWQVAGHLVEKGDNAYALFFGHLTLEKLLKALFVKMKDDTPPMTHRLVYLAEKCDLTLSEEQTEILETVTDFHLEARYPDEKFSFQKKCTKTFTLRHLNQIEEMKQWLQKKLFSET
ncbi:MAG: HEPN domain-containing protein [Desulfosudaceae bacterium]